MRRIITAREQFEMLSPWREAMALHEPHMEHPDGPNGMWHGSPSGDLRGGHYGLHVGSYSAAKEVLPSPSWRTASEDGSALSEFMQWITDRTVTEGLSLDQDGLDRFAQEHGLDTEDYENISALLQKGGDDVAL